MQWFASLPPVFVTVIAVAALISTRKILVAWLNGGRPADELSPRATHLLERLDARLLQLESQVSALSDELAATRTEFRALARGAVAPALADSTRAGQDGVTSAESAEPDRATLSP